MADAIISVVAERVAAIIEDQIRYEVNLVRGVEKEILDLSNKLKTIQNVLDDAEKRGVKEQSVKSWLKKLEDTAYEMDDILDEWNYTLLRTAHDQSIVASAKQKVCWPLIPSSCFCFNKVVVRHDTAKKIQNVKISLDGILREKDDFNFVTSLSAIDHVPKSWRVQSTSSVEHEKVYGRDADRDNIMKKLMLDGNSQILSIVGMGGIGKTTLAQLVFNDTQVKECFELKIWICVSDPFDVAEIARGIVENVKKEIIPPNTQLELLLEKLRDCISGKKFLLVLDDVWTEDNNKWEPLKINLKFGALTSKILVTTRNERVAKKMGTLDDEIYRPPKLNDEECWTVLRRISLSGRSEEECGEFENVGKQIASKCKGLPLAANVLGSLLQFKNSLEEWENVWKSEIWQLEEAEVELFPHLVLSYNELSPALKRCFSYCAIYPKDERINAEGLIKEWMALGYLGSVTENIGGVELKGREYFNNLAMRCLFQDFEESDFRKQIKWCKMHDIVHDFAQFLRKNNFEMRKRSCQVCGPCIASQAQEYRSLFLHKGTPTHICDCLTSLRVLRLKGLLNHDGFPHGMEKLIHLRWLGLTDIKLSKEDLKIICRLYFLQILLLPSCSLEEIPGEIGNLVRLRHLDLSTNDELRELPEIMCSLLELQILDIEGCRSLYELPQGIHMLEKLQHLLIEDTPASHHFPQGVGQLRGLRSLSEFHGGSGSNKLALLKNLNYLSGSLKLKIHCSSMSDLEELDEEAREAELRNKIHIQRLDIIIEDEMEPTSSSSSLWVEVIEALEPYHKLKEVEIWGYKGSRLPHWMSSPLNLITWISLTGLSEVWSLSSMGKLPFLEGLFLWSMKELKLVGREFLGIETSSTKDDVVFPKLKILMFSFCYKWLEWEDISVEEEEECVVMPCLTELRINWCEGLKKLPHRLLRKASSLQILEMNGSWELLNSYGDKDGSPWRSISKYNPQLRLSY